MGIVLLVVLQATWDYDVGIVTTFFLNERMCKLDLRSNYKMGLEPIGISLMETMVRAIILIMTLNKSIIETNLMS